jgi:integrase
MAIPQNSGDASCMSVSPVENLASTLPDPLIGNKPFGVIARKWLDLQKFRLRKRTYKGYELHLVTLGKFFGQMRLKDIHIGPLLGYQQARILNEGQLWKKSCGPSIVNHEICTLQSVMKFAGMWAPIADLYKPLTPSGWHAPKVMSDAEKKLFFAVARSRPEWELAFHVAKVTSLTSAAGTELRNLQLQDVILDAGVPRIVIQADTAKNNYRGRVVTLVPEAQESIRWCLERASGLRSFRPEHYLFPFRLGRNAYDPERPTTDSWLKRVWKDVSEAAGMTWITPHCLRHQCITELLEKGVQPEMVRHIAGHVSQKMMEHYSHCRHEQQAEALSLLTDKSAAHPQRSSGKSPSKRHGRFAPPRRAVPSNKRRIIRVS